MVVNCRLQCTGELWIGPFSPPLLGQPPYLGRLP